MMVLAVKDTITIAYDPKDDEIKLVTDKNDKNFSHLDDLYKVINKKNNTVVWEIKYDEADWILGKESKGFVNFSPIAMDKIKDQKVYFDFDELKPKDYKEGDPVTGQVCIAEYVLSNTGERLKGPESEKVRFGLEKKDYIGVMRWGDFLG